MHPRALLTAAALAAMAVLAIIAALIWKPWESDGSRNGANISDQPRMTLEGVIALVSAEHAGCPDQPTLVLTADAAYQGDGKWTVTYGDHSWDVDEEAESVRSLGDPLPCPAR